MTFVSVRLSGWLFWQPAVFLYGIRRQAGRHIEDGCLLLSKKTAHRRDKISLFELGNRTSAVRWSSYRLSNKDEVCRAQTGLQVMWRRFQRHTLGMSGLVTEEANNKLAEIPGREPRPDCGNSTKHCYINEDVPLIVRHATLKVHDQNAIVYAKVLCWIQNCFKSKAGFPPPDHLPSTHKKSLAKNQTTTPQRKRRRQDSKSKQRKQLYSEKINKSAVLIFRRSMGRLIYPRFK